MICFLKMYLPELTQGKTAEDLRSEGDKKKTNNLKLVRGLAHIYSRKNISPNFLGFDRHGTSFLSIVWMLNGKMGTSNGLNID